MNWTEARMAAQRGSYKPEVPAASTVFRCLQFLDFVQGRKGASPTNVEPIPDGSILLTDSDGTIVTLYRWEHPYQGYIWCLSTSNG